MDYETGINIAKNFKAHDKDIRRAIKKCEKAQHGVVALRFRQQGKVMSLEILDEPYESDVRVYPGD